MKPDNELISLLLTLGLTRNDALTYATLLQTASVSIRKISSYTGINRGTTYESLKRLVTLGLVSVKEKNERGYFTAESPKRINDIIRDKRRDLLDSSTKAQTVIPRLLSQHRHTSQGPIVRYYEGDEGVVTILKDVLETCRLLHDPYYYCYSSKRIRQFLYRKFPQFTDRRVAAGIRVKVIAVGEGGEKAKGAERKWLSNSSGTNASSYTIIYGDKIAIISVSNDLIPFGLVVEEPGTANMQRVLFEQLWEYL